MGNDNTIRPPDEPKTVVEWLWYVKRYDKGIFVREQVKSKWRNVALADLPPDRWAFHVARWLNENALPCRVKEPEEMAGVQPPL